MHSYKGFIFQISHLTWYTRFDPVTESKEVVVSDLQTIEDATQYSKDMENDAYPTKEGTLSNPYASTDKWCCKLSDLSRSISMIVQLSSRGRQSHFIFFNVFK